MNGRPRSLSFHEVLEQARQGILPGRDQLKVLLHPQGKGERVALFEAARHVRDLHFGRAVFLYGFVYTSTHCRNNCRFCLYRASNPKAPRYRKATGEILDVCERLAQSGVHLLDITLGEDPRIHRPDATGWEDLVGLVSDVVQRTGVPVMVSPGVAPRWVLAALARAGADWYACYQETHNRDRFRDLRVGQDYEARMQAKEEAKAEGLLLEEGILCGLGETDDDLLDSLEAMGALDADQVRVMTFVPQPGTPLQSAPRPSPQRELVLIAVMRLLFPDRLIPASLDVEGLAGLRARLQAGANVVTSIVPPGRGLAGVAHSSLDIETERRTVQAVMKCLAGLDLRPASLEDYRSWMAGRRAA
ncbi:pyrrolysine biosynthesis protein PylB [Desulfacinum infernum DSM 9756]|uniref:Pyrrolysine biosynthesis protein PylB n=1 Tax=Desulfacinum infernum DSM 9756 TaxID=1121391 RepID=A0A1M5CGL2_9BACT|nr:methylornithine synthase PylB [Desulfacinum infernum]SHF53858.1 pyrrolysine biosynthesis protein PylB [Desulfacinum infernum DSM 9756]